jgi:hypothetical protein
MAIQRFSYPKPVKTRIGVKVRWYYYEEMEDAQKAAKVAKAEAPVREAQGYDFGYQSPGSITLVQGASEYAGLYEVCLP